jgi:hypothetical protein
MASPAKTYNQMMENYLRQRNFQMSMAAAKKATGNTKIFAERLLKGTSI